MLCVVSGFLLSVVIESFQYCLCLGRAETDDVICNTLGCMLGVMANIMGCL
ncbi:VanZ family protein [Ruminococcus sp. 1001136sp1]|uniref:VanZ family protein n=1 Tax=Ruminococcus sp. 1001136sp1 TaxID=2986996 RepID=UPI003FA71BD6